MGYFRLRLGCIVPPFCGNASKVHIIHQVRRYGALGYSRFHAGLFKRLAHGQPGRKSMALIPNTGSAIPVFISYSWDSEDHKKWVRDFAARLRGDGIEAIIDQTHLPLGARSPEFMERSVRESRDVLVVCTEGYKGRFDNRQGGAGYEGHIITGEIINEVGKNKFIPVLRSGNWKNAMPTALLGVYGVDLREDSGEEYRKLITQLHGISDISPVGAPPSWLMASPNSSGTSGVVEAIVPDSNEFLEQRKKLADTDIMRKIWSRPRWCIWIRPSEFKRARFQNLEQCREFMISSYVLVQGWFPYPWFSADSLETGNEWIAGEIDQSGRTERWVLFRSGQFVHNRAFDEIPQLGGRVHVLEILDTVTGAIELAGRMAHRGVLSPKAVITVDLYGVDGRNLTWPDDMLGHKNAVSSNCWCQDEAVNVTRLVAPEELETQGRALALGVALEIYSKFAWSDPPRPRLIEEQNRRFGA
jgi:hypothetical protein